MKISTIKTKSVTAGIGIALLAGGPLLADDTELLLFKPHPLQDPKPNILFILDTSGSMASMESTILPYDGAQVYGGSCDSDKLYWTDVDVIPDCTASSNFVEDEFFYCNAAERQLAGLGSFTNTMSQYRGGGSDGQSAGAETWQSLASGYDTAPVECQTDSGIHGDGRSAHLWAKKGSNLLDPFTTEVTSALSWGSAPQNVSYTVYDGNFLNWKASPVNATLSRAEIMQAVIKNILGSVDNMNVGLMRFNNEQGGAISVGIKDLEDNRTEILNTIDTFDPNRQTPLAESMYEAALYWRGLPAHFYGAPEDYLPPATYFPTDPSAYSSTSPNTYEAPEFNACSKNYNVLLSDGEPNRDLDVPPLIPNLPGFESAIGSLTCRFPGVIGPDGLPSNEGACLEEVAKYLSVSDVDTAEPGNQLVTTYTIGFAIDIPLLSRTAVNSGGEYFLADDVESLTQSLMSIIGDINDRTLSFTAPAVSVNTFNRTRNLNDLYVSEFGVKANAHWPGNLKKYRITNREITDANDVAAIDPTTGYFKDTVADFWSSSSGDNDVQKGGAASKLPDPSVRKIYTNNSGTDLTQPTNIVSPDNLSAFSDADFGLTGASGEPTMQEIIRWALGEDLRDVNPNSLIRYEMGDPLHSQPAAVVYGGTESSPDTVVYMATNDGYLHAIDGATGVELWSFIPKDLLSNLTRLYFDPDSNYKQYGIDGNIVPAVKDVNRDGVIDPLDGDFVYLVFGMRRGGNSLYALDVSYKNAPKMKWKVNLPQFGETWSAPVISRMEVSSVTQNPDKTVIVVGGGYDTVHDTANHPAAADGVGAGIHVLDLESGDELWRTGPDSGADLQLSTMTRAISTSVRVIDLTGDGFADRLYASDMGGRIWRFDVFNGQSPSALITGGVIAELGAEGTGSSALADTRRFYNAPDVSVFLDTVQQRRYIAVSIGSGYRSHPLDLSAKDQFYSIRDANVFTKLSQSDYSAYPIVQESDLIEVSGKTGVVVTTADRGWKFTLPDNQKVLADSLTFDDQVLFVAFTPDFASAVNCSAGQGANYLYRMAVTNGDPIVPYPSLLEPGNADDARRDLLRQTGIAPSPTILFPSPDDLTCPAGTDCSPPPLNCIGTECFDAGFENNPVRTLWTQDGIE
jgi:type IV pilus assembly protein PilY1